ncbi:MAG: sporulation protein YtxC [Clostridia bacterium]|nr:sporulation protein YtxC [Clostridia bacterium]
MPSWCVVSTEYDVDLKTLYARRLSQTGANHSFIQRGNALYVTVRGQDAVRIMAEVCARVMCRDLMYFALAKLVDRMPLTLSEKQSALTIALKAARSAEELAAVEEGLIGFLKSTRDFCPEGYMQFRMRACQNLWRLCVEQATAEILMQKEFSEIVKTLNSYAAAIEPRILELQLCIHADGSCTLTDESLVRIEYVDCSVEGIVSLLVNMAPKNLIVYDLSGNAENRLTEAIAKVFCGRVKIYK